MMSIKSVMLAGRNDKFERNEGPAEKNIW